MPPQAPSTMSISPSKRPVTVRMSTSLVRYEPSPSAYPVDGTRTRSPQVGRADPPDFVATSGFPSTRNLWTRAVVSDDLVSVGVVTDLRERAEEHLRALAGPTARLRDDQWTAVE